MPPAPADAPLTAATSPSAPLPPRNLGKCHMSSRPSPVSLSGAASLNFMVLGFFWLRAPGGMEGENPFAVNPVPTEVRGSWEEVGGEPGGQVGRAVY